MPDGGAPTAAGPFIAVVGPSGAGKDTILSLCRARLEADGHVRFARRVVTRVSNVEAEDHDCLDEAAFEAAERAGAFCLTWRAHGLSYGLPAALCKDCEAGRAVIANLSRRSLAEAAERFATLHVVEVTAPRALLIARIAGRGRETAGEIEARLARSIPLVVPERAFGPHVIDNSGSAEAAASTFLALVRRLTARVGAPA